MMGVNSVQTMMKRVRFIKESCAMNSGKSTIDSMKLMTKYMVFLLSLSFCLRCKYSDFPRIVQGEIPIYGWGLAYFGTYWRRVGCGRIR